MPYSRRVITLKEKVHVKSMLVTGGNSFIAKHLIPALVAPDKRVYAISRSSKPNSQNSHLVNLELENVIHIEGDLTDAAFMDSLKLFPQVIIHCAANSSTKKEDSNQVFKDNVLGTANLLDFSQRVNCQRIIHLSTISVHGKITEPYVSHETGFLEPSLYGMSKRISEIVLSKASTDQSIFAIRLPAVLGEGTKNHWIARTVSQILTNHDIEIQNPDSLFNNIVEVNDLLTFILSLLESNQSGFHAFPIASTSPISIKKVVQILIHACASRSKIMNVETSRSSFTIDDSLARIRYGYKSKSTEAALKHYMSNTNSTI